MGGNAVFICQWMYVDSTDWGKLSEHDVGARSKKAFSR